MNDLLPFGTRLRRLLDRRATPATALAKAAGVPVAQLDAVLAGGEPDDPLLRRLAPALGLQTADLFLFAARTLPDDLAPAELTGPWKVNDLVLWRYSLASMQARAQLRRFVDELPVVTVPRTQPFPCDGHETTPGEIVARLLANRNMRLDMGTMVLVGGGPPSARSTYWSAWAGRIRPIDEYANALARTVGIPISDLTALLGIESAEVPWDQPHPWPADLVELAWAARRLNDEQLRAAMEYAKTSSSCTTES